MGGRHLDTREKIVSFDEAQQRAGGKPVRWVSGYFDPLLAEQARRLAQLRTPGRRLGVVIRNPSRALLPARARAELVAALSAVDFVVLEAGAIAAEDLNDLFVTRQFSAHVRRRHQGEGA